ncbi:Pre-rRNA-processing protein RIX1, N-terminal [Dillenia turbinata]|uniref:Pre-rRNA-processing protein RIX1, N-terminal n=1 Tax=Dillenia turbinata TaxID=194707 RepID=A0AAN8VCH5_9MAGN
MASFDHFINMYDIKLKPRILRTVMKQHIPDEKHPVQNPTELSTVLSLIKTHRLLSESFDKSANPAHAEEWKSAVDKWVDRLSTLVSSKLPDKCWMGICLLGVTCQECGSDRFWASYSNWFSMLLTHIQAPSDSHFVRIACFASISDLLTRLTGFSNAKKDGTSLAGKLVQPILKLLNENISDAVQEGAVDLLCKIINLFPSSIVRHYESVETATASKILSGRCGDIVMKKCAYCLALLPKSKGDEHSWSLMMQKILFTVNGKLNDGFQGLEESRGSEITRFLVPAGMDPPPPLGGQQILESSNHALNMSEQLILSTVSYLMLCCCTMLDTPYPVQVTLPIRALVALMERILMMDGSLPQALLPFISVTQQENLCMQLPVLHSDTLDLLTATIKRVRSQLLPHAARIVRILTEYFQRCQVPMLRVKVYSIIKILLISFGIGVISQLAHEVIQNASIDLDCGGQKSSGFSSAAHSEVITETLMHSSNRKRKQAGTTRTIEEQQSDMGAELPKNKPTTPIQLKIAALEALEALLTVGGSLGSETWRPNIDSMVLTVAASACNGGWSSEEQSTLFQPTEPMSSCHDLQLAALRALLASLVSPARVRPPYLHQGLELFRKGKQEVGTKLAGFCAHALLALELLIHPRALPLIDVHPKNYVSFDERMNSRFPQKMLSDSQRNNGPISIGQLGMGSGDSHADYDELYDSWLGNGDAIEVQKSNHDADVIHSKEPQTSREPEAEKPVSSVPSSEVMIADEKEKEAMAVVLNRATGHEDEIMVEVPLIQEPVATVVAVPIVSADSACANAEKVMISLETSADVNAENVKVSSETGVLEHADTKMACDTDVSVAKIENVTSSSKTTLTVTDSKNQEYVFALNDEQSMDLFPDIVDGDPDSD